MKMLFQHCKQADCEHFTSALWKAPWARMTAQRWRASNFEAAQTIINSLDSSPMWKRSDGVG